MSRNAPRAISSDFLSFTLCAPESNGALGDRPCLNICQMITEEQVKIVFEVVA